jgi:hypothetical protein
VFLPIRASVGLLTLESPETGVSITVRVVAKACTGPVTVAVQSTETVPSAPIVAEESVSKTAVEFPLTENRVLLGTIVPGVPVKTTERALE